MKKIEHVIDVELKSHGRNTWHFNRYIVVEEERNEYSLYLDHNLISHFIGDYVICAMFLAYHMTENQLGRKLEKGTKIDFKEVLIKLGYKHYVITISEPMNTDVQMSNMKGGE